MNLMPMNFSGYEKIGQIWNETISKLPQLIRESKAFQLEMERIGDIEKINDTHYAQLKAISGEVGIDPSVIPEPIQGQNPEEYITKGVQTFMNSAKNQEVDPKTVVDSLAKLTGGGAIEEVKGAQEHFKKKRETESALFGRDLSEASQFGGGVSPGEGDRPYQDIMTPFMQKPSPYELPEGSEGGVGASLDEIVAEKEVKSQAIPIMEDPELMNQLQLLPRAQRRLVMKKLQDPDEKYYETDAIKEIADYVGAQTKLREAKEKAGLTHKRKMEEKEMSEITGPKAREQQARKSKVLDTYLNALVSNELYDLEGNPVEYFNIGEALKGNYQVGKKRPTEHVTTVVGGGGKGARDKTYQELLARKEMLINEINTLLKMKTDPKILAASGKTVDQVDAQISSIEKDLVRLEPDIETARQRQGFTDKPEPGKTDPTANMTPKDKQAYEWANANSADPRAAKILEKLKATYGF